MKQMTAEEIQKKLEYMKGKTFTYANTEHTVISYIINAEEEVFTIVTDKNQFRRRFESAKEYFKYWMQASNVVTQTVENKKREIVHTDPEPPAQNNQLSTEVMQPGLSDYLVETLKRTIEKVEKNASYINQAKAIDKQVDTILKVKKLELEMAKTVNQLKKGR